MRETRDFDEQDLLLFGYSARLFDGEIYLNMSNGLFVNLQNHHKVLTLKRVFHLSRTVKGFDKRKVIASRKHFWEKTLQRKIY